MTICFFTKTSYAPSRFASHDWGGTISRVAVWTTVTFLFHGTLWEDMSFVRTVRAGFLSAIYKFIQECHCEHIYIHFVNYTLINPSTARANINVKSYFFLIASIACWCKSVIYRISLSTSYFKVPLRAIVSSNIHISHIEAILKIAGKIWMIKSILTRAIKYSLTKRKFISIPESYPILLAHAYNRPRRDLEESRTAYTASPCPSCNLTV